MNSIFQFRALGESAESLYFEVFTPLTVRRQPVGKVVLQNGVTFYQMIYDNEKELERTAVQNSHALFGEDAVYFDIKQILTSPARISKIPDGLLLTLSRDDSKLWIVEYELADHDLEGHIIPQILGFINSLKSESTKKSVKERMYRMIKSGNDSLQKVKSVLPADGEIYHFLDKVIDQKFGIIIVIDRKTPDLDEVVFSVSEMTKSENQVLEFITYQSSNGEMLHVIDSLNKGTTAKGKSTSEMTRGTRAKNNDWQSRFARSLPDTKKLIEQVINDTQKSLKCSRGPWYNWYAFHIREPRQRKTMFAALIPAKREPTLCFRVDPVTFDDSEDTELRRVKGFFFPSETERRIKITPANLEKTRKYVWYAHSTTLKLQKS